MENTNKTAKSELYRIDPRNIVVVENFNCRCSFGDIDALAEEIRAQGVLNPITVIPFKDENNQDKYRLVDGERRYRAVMKLLNEGVEIARIPAICASKSLTDDELYIQQALRNEGKTFTAYEWGVLALRLKEKCGLTITEIGKKLGKNPGDISRYLGYLEYNPELQQMLKDEIISAPTLDRVLKSNNGDQTAAINELKRLDEDRKKDGKEKISLRQYNKEPQQVIKKDTKIIKSGMEKVFEYIERYKAEYGIEVEITYDLMKYIVAQIGEGKTIDAIFNKIVEMVCNQKKAE